MRMLRHSIHAVEGSNCPSTPPMQSSYDIPINGAPLPHPCGRGSWSRLFTHPQTFCSSACSTTASMQWRVPIALALRLCRDRAVVLDKPVNVTWGTVCFQFLAKCKIVTYSNQFDLMS